MSVIRYVDSLENIDPTRFVGEFFVLPNGEIYQAQATDSLAGFGAVFSKILGIAAPFAAFIPGVGPLIATGLGAASKLIGSSSGGGSKLSPADDAAIKQVVDATAAVSQQVEAQQITAIDANSAIAGIYQKWAAYKMQQPSVDDRNYLYQQELAILKPAWDQVDKRANELGVTSVAGAVATGTSATAGASSTSLPFGLTWTEIGIGVALFFALRR